MRTNFLESGAVDSSVLPNLLIIGAPRCGTTSLHDWLVAHPSIAGTRIKETFYMMDRASAEFVPGNNVHDHGLAGYARLFERCTGAAVRLESTTGYLYQQTALARLPELDSQPRFIAVLREPAARVLSIFRYFQGHKAELPAQWSFREFIERVDRGDDSISRNEFLRDVLDQSRYAKHLDRWRQRVGRERIRPLLFEELMGDPQRCVPPLADWCGVDPEFFQSYGWPHRNESYAVRNPRLHALVRRLLLPLAGSERIKRGLRGLYISLNGRRVARPDAEEREVLAQLRERFAADNATLAREWELDLAPWNP